MALSRARATFSLPNRFLNSRPAVWYSCLILVQTDVKEEDLKRSHTRDFCTLFCSSIALRLRVLPFVLTWVTLQLQVCMWPCIPLSWSLTSWFDPEPVSSLQSCPAIIRPLADHGHQVQFLTLSSDLPHWLATWTAGWSSLPSLDLLCLPCLGTVGLGPCGEDTVPACLVYSWLVAHLPLRSNALARALPNKQNFEVRGYQTAQESRQVERSVELVKGAPEHWRKALSTKKEL